MPLEKRIKNGVIQDLTREEIEVQYQNVGNFGVFPVIVTDDTTGEKFTLSYQIICTIDRRSGAPIRLLRCPSSTDSNYICAINALGLDISKPDVWNIYFRTIRSRVEFGCEQPDRGSISNLAALQMLTGGGSRVNPSVAPRVAPGTMACNKTSHDDHNQVYLFNPRTGSLPVEFRNNIMRDLVMGDARLDPFVTSLVVDLEEFWQPVANLLNKKIVIHNLDPSDRCVKILLPFDETELDNRANAVSPVDNPDAEQLHLLFDGTHFTRLVSFDDENFLGEVSRVRAHYMRNEGNFRPGLAKLSREADRRSSLMQPSLGLTAREKKISRYDELGGSDKKRFLRKENLPVDEITLENTVQFFDSLFRFYNDKVKTNESISHTDIIGYNSKLSISATSIDIFAEQTKKYLKQLKNVINGLNTSNDNLSRLMTLLISAKDRFKDIGLGDEISIGRDKRDKLLKLLKDKVNKFTIEQILRCYNSLSPNDKQYLLSILDDDKVRAISNTEVICRLVNSNCHTHILTYDQIHSIPNSFLESLPDGNESVSNFSNDVIVKLTSRELRAILDSRSQFSNEQIAHFTYQQIHRISNGRLKELHKDFISKLNSEIFSSLTWREVRALAHGMTPLQISKLNYERQIHKIPNSDLKRMSADFVINLTEEIINKLSTGEFNALISKLTPKQLGYVKKENWNKDNVRLLTDEQLRGDLPASLLENIEFMKLLTQDQLDKIKPELIPNINADFLTLDVVINLKDEQFAKIPFDKLKNLFNGVYGANRSTTDHGINICDEPSQKQHEFCERFVKVLNDGNNENEELLLKIIAFDPECIKYLSSVKLNSLFSKRDQNNNKLLFIPTRQMIRQMEKEQLVELAKVLHSQEFNNIVLGCVSRELREELVGMIHSGNIQFMAIPAPAPVPAPVVPATAQQASAPAEPAPASVLVESVNESGSALAPAKSDAEFEIMADIEDKPKDYNDAYDALYFEEYGPIRIQSPASAA